MDVEIARDKLNLHRHVDRRRRVVAVWKGACVAQARREEGADGEGVEQDKEDRYSR